VTRQRDRRVHATGQLVRGDPQQEVANLDELVADGALLVEVLEVAVLYAMDELGDLGRAHGGSKDKRRKALSASTDRGLEGGRREILSARP